jgi:alpha-1,2-mannosyltransferase
MEASANLAAQLCSGEWFTRRRVRAFATILLVIELAAFCFLVAGTHGWIVPLDKPNTTDFVSFYAAGGLADAGTPALAYDQAAHLAAEEAIVGKGIEYQYFNYPPVYQALFAPIAWLPYLAAFVLFEAMTLMFYLVVARRILDDYSDTALLVLVGFPIVFWNIGLGQNAFLTAGLFGAATILIDRRPALAGLCFGVLCYKPHLRAFAAAAASALVLVFASLALLGWDTWHAFLLAAGASHSMYESGRILFGGFVNPFGAMRLWHASIPVSYTVQALFSVVAASVVAIVWHRGASLPSRAAVLASATLVAVPLSLLYDLMLDAIAACWLLRGEGQRCAPWEKTVLAISYAALFDSRGLADQTALPVNTLAALALFALATRRAFVELGWLRISPAPAAATTTT